MKNQDCLLFSVQSSFIQVVSMYIDKCSNSCLNLQSVRFKPGTFSLLWRRCFWFQLWKSQKQMNLSFIYPTRQWVYPVNLAYPYSAYKIEKGHLSPFLLNRFERQMASAISFLKNSLCTKLCTKIRKLILNFSMQKSFILFFY